MSPISAELTAAPGAAVTSFDQLPIRPSTLQALSRMEITEPTPVQAAALPLLLDGRDVIAQARTGSGKTLAFVIPAIELVDPRSPAVQVLVLTPTRELAAQIDSVLSELTGQRGMRSVQIFGGRAQGPQVAALRGGAQVVIGTPGRVLDLLDQRALSLDRVRFLVLDEADQMLDDGFGPNVERIMARTPRTRQTALFSATVPEWVSTTARKYLNQPVTVAVDPKQSDVPAIEHAAYDLMDDDKLPALHELLDMRGEGSIIIFGRTKHGVKKLARRLERDGYPVGELQGNLSQNARDRVMDRFRTGEVQILVATNVAARGLDITSVDLVINLELPESADLLTHRVGRTGRMGRQGRAVTLLGPEDAVKWRKLQQGLGLRIPRAPWRGAAEALGQDGAPATRAPRPRHTAPPAGSRPIGDAGTTGARPAAARPATRSSNRESMPQRMSERTPARQEQPERTSIVCTSCGEEAVVPFRPDPSRPVYCDSCHRSRRSSRSRVAR